MKINLRNEATTTQRPAAVNRPQVGSEMRPAERPEAHMNNEEKKSTQKFTRIPKIIDLIAIGAVYLLAFLVPIFFLPNVPSVLELNKQMLIVLLGGIAFLAWIGKLAWEGKIRVKKNVLLIPILVLILIFALNTIFSIYRDQSMWGALGLKECHW